MMYYFVPRQAKQPLWVPILHRQFLGIDIDLHVAGPHHLMSNT